VKDQLYDPDGPHLQIGILRCLNCGGTTYLTKERVEAGYSNNEEIFPEQRPHSGLGIVQT